MAPKNSASTRNHWAATADTKTDSPLLATGIDDEFEIWNGTAHWRRIAEPLEIHSRAGVGTMQLHGQGRPRITLARAETAE